MNVVYGVCGAWWLFIFFLQQIRDHAALPIITMHYVRRNIKHTNSLCNCGVEKRKTLTFIHAHTAVNVITPEVIFVINKQELNTVVFQHVYSAILIAPPELHKEIANVRHRVGKICVNVCVTGHYDPCFFHVTLHGNG